MTDDAAPIEATPVVVFDAVPAVAAALALPPGAVAAVLALLDDDNTVPFIARYRKERTGGLDEVQIRAIEEKRGYLVELETRRAAILASVTEQGKLVPALEAKLRAATTKAELEDLYAPYRVRRKTRASVARDRGLQPLADRILAQAADGDPAAEAATFVSADKGVETADAALAGARDIAAETIADTAEVRAYVRRVFAQHGELVSEVVPGKGDEPTKFEQYYAFKEAVKTIPSHRFLAIRRGEAEGVLRAHVAVDTAKTVAGIERLASLAPSSPWADALRAAVADALKRLLAPSVENDVRAELKQRSDGAAVDIFAGNLANLLVAPPLGASAVIGVDPGLRTGCKCAAIDATGRFLGTVTVYVTQGDAQLAKAKDDFLAFVKLHQPRAIAVGNGTGGREAEAFVKQVLAEAGMRGRAAKRTKTEAATEAVTATEAVAATEADAVAEAGGEAAPVADGVPVSAHDAVTKPVDEAAAIVASSPAPFVVQVNEAGASVYSASDLAREEFPELDLTIRGAISIARRLQDPLAELVKVEPKSIGVGQYQHDVHQPLLAKRLGDVVEDCVNRIGVELNTSSAQLLGYVAGIGKSLAKKLVLHRDSHGAFASRAQLLEVAGLGPRAFEQAAGFLRIRGAANPLDASAVHPERYALVERIAGDLGVAVPALVGDRTQIERIDVAKYVGDGVGEPTLRDIIAELAKPGRDPRAEFAPPKFRDDVTSMEDLKPGMVLEGIVTNVTAFGAFVDIGVHNDGLVHVSQLAEQFVKDPSEVVKVGQKLTVRVIEVDTARKRIGLSARRPQQQQHHQQQARDEQYARGGGGGERRDDNNGGGGNRGGRGRGGRGRGGGGGQPQQQHPHQQPHGEHGHAQSGAHANAPHDANANAPHDASSNANVASANAPGGDVRATRQYEQRGARPDNRGPNDRGPNNGGGWNPGPNDRGPENRGPENRGPENRGPENRGPENRGGQFRGPENRGPENRGPENRGPNDRGPDNRGPNDRGPNNRGPNTGGGWDNRGPNNRGPNNGGGWDNRGPNNRGPNDRGPNDRGPNNGGGWDNRGPNNRGPNDRGPNDRGPNDRGPNDRGPRPDHRNRDDRGPRSDGPPPQQQPGYGVSGFVNNPFAKVLGGDKPKRS